MLVLLLTLLDGLCPVKIFQRRLHQLLQQGEDQVADLGHGVLLGATVQFAVEGLAHFRHKLAVYLHNFDQLAAV